MTVQTHSNDSFAPTLAEEQRSLVRSRILRAARHVLADTGLETRVEDVASAAGVSRRTIFRYFPTRDELLAAAVAESIRSYSEHVPRPEADADLPGWLAAALHAVHHLNARNGRIYWDLALRRESDGPLADVSAERRDARRDFVSQLTDTAWRLAGGSRRPPAWLVDAFAVQLSAFTTESLAGDFGRSPSEVAEVAARVLTAALAAALSESDSA